MISYDQGKYHIMPHTLVVCVCVGVQVHVQVQVCKCGRERGGVELASTACTLCPVQVSGFKSSD